MTALHDVHVFCIIICYFFVYCISFEFYMYSSTDANMKLYPLYRLVPLT